MIIRFRLINGIFSSMAGNVPHECVGERHIPSRMCVARTDTEITNRFFVPTIKGVIIIYSPQGGTSAFSRVAVSKTVLLITTTGVVIESDGRLTFANKRPACTSSFRPFPDEISAAYPGIETRVTSSTAKRVRSDLSRWRLERARINRRTEFKFKNIRAKIFHDFRQHDRKPLNAISFVNEVCRFESARQRYRGKTTSNVPSEMVNRLSYSAILRAQRSSSAGEPSELTLLISYINWNRTTLINLPTGPERVARPPDDNHWSGRYAHSPRNRSKLLCLETYLYYQVGWKFFIDSITAASSLRCRPDGRRQKTVPGHVTKRFVGEKSIFF